MKLSHQISLVQAAKLVQDGDTIMVGGFGMTGSPVQLLHALAETEVKDLTYIGNNLGEAGFGVGRLLRKGKIKKAIGSFFTSNPEAVIAAENNEIEVMLIPQGSMVEAIRAGGAGIGGFYTPTGANTSLAETNEIKNIHGKSQVFVPALRANIALIHATKADKVGNLVYHRTEQNFNRAMATAADLVIAQVEEIVSLGGLDPNEIHTPGIFVDYLVQANTRIEDMGSSAKVQTKINSTGLQIAKRALQELQPGQVVNLGVGIPTLLANMILPEHKITLHTENGMLGVGPPPEEGSALDYPVNAGKQPVTELPGSSYFDSAESFAMIRGGHIDVAIMGGLQVDAVANLANWTVPGKGLLGVGGAMDLAIGAKQLIITMRHTDRAGNPKIVPDCTLPLTAKKVVDTIVTELAVFKFRAGGLTLVEIQPTSSLDEIRAKTSANFKEGLV